MYDMDKAMTRLSKFMSLVLRHNPGLVGIKLDENGWVDVDELISKSKAKGTIFSKEEMDYVVENNNKKRFAYSEDGKRIRASQGHSIEVELGYKPIKPPEILYHGTSTRFLESILKQGLLKQQRQHVHLSKDLDTAIAVGKRHGGDYVVIEILSDRMFKDGCEIFVSDNGVFLTNYVSTDYFGAILGKG